MGVLLTGLLPLQTVSAQFSSAGGVDHPGDWHVGEGIKQGDFFSYEMCFVDYKECSDFQMDFWIEGEIQTGSETKWLTQVVVYDGNKVIKGNMELGQIGLEPTGGSSEISAYRSAFKSSIVWLSAFAPSEKPKAFGAVSWGKIANIGGEQIIPKELLPNGLLTPYGHFDEVILIGWRTGGANSQVFIADGFPFPIRANTWTHVSSGIPPQEYKFELLDYKENISENPFAEIADSKEQQENLNCPNHETLQTSVKKPTKNFSYQIHAFYGPEFPVDGCPMKWQIKFINKFNDAEFLDQVQYDFLVVDNDLNLIRSIAQDEGREFLYSPSGQSIVEFTVNEGPGTANYIIWVYGLAPDFVIPSESPDYLEIPLEISPNDDSKTMSVPPSSDVPSWIKTTAGYWVDGQSSDNEFLNAIKFLINQKIIVVPETTPNTLSNTGVPSWIKTTTGYWVDGTSSDTEFINSIQYMIKEGIISLQS